MVERYVFLRLNDDLANPAGRAALAERARAVLPTVPGVVSVSIGIPADDASEKSWDVSFVVRFASVDDIPAYIDHPVHQAFVKDDLMPQVKVRKAWNFELS